MKIQKSIFAFCLAIFICITTGAQQQGVGCVYEPEIDGKVPFSPRLMTRDYTALPKAYSLKQYCPTPKSQGAHGTCTAWSTTYAARTICEAVSYGWNNQDTITKEAFAPIFVYKQIVNSADCQNGSSVASALGLLQSKGAPKLTSFNVLCADYIPNQLYSEASNHRIDGYSSLFNSYSSDAYDKVQRTKKALSEGHPVVMAMDVYESFDTLCHVECWNGLKGVSRGGHAMCVIGYDDDKYGGAFEVMNSWGTGWGAKGYFWIKYEDYKSNVKYAYDVYVKKKVQPQPVPKPTPQPTPQPVPTPIQKKYSMAGNMYIVERDGGGTPQVAIDEKGDIPYYFLAEYNPSGKKFRLVVSNHEPAWVYVIASDLQNQVTKLFPYADNISAYLNYKENNIAIPDETHEFELDATPGTDYFCVLYSQHVLYWNNLTRFSP